MISLGQFLPVLTFTTWQSVLSAVFTLGLALIGVLGLLSIENLKIRRVLEGFILIPSVIPALFVILAVFNFGDLISIEVMGLNGIVVAHVFLNCGIVTIALDRVVRQRVGHLTELAAVEGAPFFLFWRKALLPLIKRDLGALFLFVFSVCFTSFAVPLIFAGQKGVTLEVLIYNRVTQKGDFQSAIFLALAQSAFVLLVSLFFSRKTFTYKESHRVVTQFGWLPGVLLPLTVSAIMLGALFGGSLAGLRQALAHSQLMEVASEAALGTLVVSMGVALMCLILLFLIATCYRSVFLQRLLFGFLSPSAVIVGFALLLIFGAGAKIAYVSMILGVTFMSLPLVFRFIGSQSLSGLGAQMETLDVLGAGAWLRFKYVLLPQLAKPFCLAAGLAGLWAAGDFALSSIVAPDDLTLALVIRTLVDGYRIALATAFIWPILLIGLVVLLIFGALGHVLSQKSLS